LTKSRTLTRSLAALSLAAVASWTSIEAQSPEPYQPQPYQPGKDVVWVPTAQTLVEKMLDVAKVTPDDFVIDLGSGDGRTVIAAAKRGAKTLGIEYNPDMVQLSKANAEKAGVGDKATFVTADIFQSDFSKATVITLFLLPELNLKLRPKILAMKPGTRVVSNSFDMGDWQADEVVTAMSECRTFCNAFFWVVPAKAQGTWQLEQGKLALQQTYQVVKGTLTSGNVVAPVWGWLKGDEIAFTAAGTEYKGRVLGDVMEGSSTTAGREAPWRATRGRSG
jgi:SAM-dependent methyltransferase